MSQTVDAAVPKNRVVVLFSGGDAPGMNSFLRAFVRLGLNRHDAVVWGAKDGYRGLVRTSQRFVREIEAVPLNSLRMQMGAQRGMSGIWDRKLDLVELDHASVSGLTGRGGIVLGSARCPEFLDSNVRRRVIHVLHELEVNAVVVCGGEGSLAGAEQLARESKLLVVGVPATIDNDIVSTELSLGVDSAVNTLMWAVERFHDTAGSHHRVMVLETMGRDCGELARLASLASGAEIVVTPERGELTIEKMQRIGGRLERSLLKGRSHAIVLVSEGVQTGGLLGQSPSQVLAEHLQRYFRREEAALPETEIRACVLGHLQRGGAPSAADRILAARFAEAAWDVISAREPRQGTIGLQLGRVGWKPFGARVCDSASPHQPLYDLQKAISEW